MASALPGPLFPGVVFKLLWGQHPNFTAADSLRGVFNGALQSLPGPGWILVECRDAPADGRGDAWELEDRPPPCYKHLPSCPLTQTCPRDSLLSHPDPVKTGSELAPSQRLHPITWTSLPTHSSVLLCALYPASLTRKTQKPHSGRSRHPEDQVPAAQPGCRTGKSWLWFHPRSLTRLPQVPEHSNSLIATALGCMYYCLSMAGIGLSTAMY